MKDSINEDEKFGILQFTIVNLYSLMHSLICFQNFETFVKLRNIMRDLTPMHALRSGWCLQNGQLQANGLEILKTRKKV